MNYGRYFSLDSESTNLVKGVTVFNYNPIGFEGGFNKMNMIECSRQDTPQYPVYLQFGKNGISIYCHYALMLPQQKSRVLHQNCLILSLTATSGINQTDNLTSRINSYFSVPFPNQLSKDEENKGERQFIKKFCKYIRSNKKDGYVHVYSERRTKEKNQDILFTLLLNFMFDLEHSDVFKNAKYYAECYKMLHENPLYDAISRKAEYYYCCQSILNSEAYSAINSEDWAFARRRWLETLTNPSQIDMLYESPWFKTIYEEIEDITEKDSKIKKKQQELTKEDNKKTICAEEQYANQLVFGRLMRRYNIWNAGKFMIKPLSQCFDYCMIRMFAPIFTAALSIRSILTLGDEYGAPSKMPWGFVAIIVLILMFFYLWYEIYKRNYLLCQKVYDTTFKRRFQNAIKSINNVLLFLLRAIIYTLLSIFLLQALLPIEGCGCEVLNMLWIWFVLSLFVGVFIQILISDSSLFSKNDL